MTTPEEQPTVGDFLARLEFKYDNDVLDFLKTGKGVVVVEDKIANIPLPKGAKGEKGDIGQLREGDVRYFNRRTDEAEAAAEASEASAGRSKASEEAAKTSETNAKTSETNAKSSETKAKASETKAKASETNAKASEKAAKTSETNAKTSETNAKASEGESTSQAEISTEAAAISALSAIAFDQLVGEGSPEGKVEAPVGAIYTDRLATNGAIRWIKTTGTGNTGWQVEPSADTATALTAWTSDAVGGRNLLRGSSAEPTEHDFTERMHYRDITEDTLLEVGQEYTFSVIVDKLSDDDHPINIQVGTGTGSNYTRDILMRYNITLGERTIITFTPTEHHLDGRTHFAWRIRNQQNETKVAYREAKLERGPVATPWTPAPEDSVQSLLEGNPLSSLLSPFPAHDPALALRVDNSVGTRVFVGDTMIYGDTGWRIWTEGMIDGWLGKPYLRRIGSRVYLSFSSREALRVDPDADKTNHPFVNIPSGFRGGIKTLGVGYLNDGYGAAPAWCYGTSSLSVTDRPEMAFGNLSWDTSNPWPTTLPGTPG